VASFGGGAFAAFGVAAGGLGVPISGFDVGGAKDAASALRPGPGAAFIGADAVPPLFATGSTVLPLAVLGPNLNPPCGTRGAFPLG
jgi:hypothetical protein